MCNHNRITSLRLLSSMILLGSVCARAQSVKSSYPAMSLLAEYLIPDETAEIALARSSAPASISNNAAVLVLRTNGYATVAKGSNGFVCIVERSWAKPTDDPEFWNPKIRAPNCFNSKASDTFLPIYLKKTELALAGKSKAEIREATASAFARSELPALASGAMCYMMAKQQYLSDEDTNWYPHVMFFVSGDAAKSWGANLPGSPVIAGNDPEERVTVFMMMAGTWSDGTPGPSKMH